MRKIKLRFGDVFTINAPGRAFDGKRAELRSHPRDHIISAWLLESAEPYRVNQIVYYEDSAFTGEVEVRDEEITTPGAEVGPVASARSTEGEPRQGSDAGRNVDESNLSAASIGGDNAHTPYLCYRGDARPRFAVSQFPRRAPWRDDGNSKYPMIVALDDVATEVARARSKFPGSKRLYSALAEEFGELAKALLQRAEGRNGVDKGSVYAEAKQCAAMAIRIMEEGDPIYDDMTDEEAQP